MKYSAPGEYVPLRDRWGSFESLLRDLDSDSLVLVDRRVLNLHPAMGRAFRKRKLKNIVPLVAGERLKSVETLQDVLARAVLLPRSGTLLAIGGGTLGDLATVAAHLIKRGVRLINVPTTLLAAVDSSVGGKGAVHVHGDRRTLVKNAAGVFHYPSESWLCPELFGSLSPRQLREGKVEAWKMAVCLHGVLWRRLSSEMLSMRQLIVAARGLKESVCARDPYERTGDRQVLNFGHTFGHVLESVTRFGLSHGDAVGLGILCALDIGRAVFVTPPYVAEAVESAFVDTLGIPGRRRLRAAFSTEAPTRIRRLLLADKKVASDGQVRMILLRDIASTKTVPIPDAIWRDCFSAWGRGYRPWA